MAKFYEEDGSITSTDRVLDEYHKKKGTRMEQLSNDYLGATLEEASKDTNSWNKVISGTKRNSDGTPDMGDISDGYHTFNELYEHRSILFLALLRSIQDTNEFAEYESLHIFAHPWYSKKHEDGTMFPGMFIAGMSTDRGSVTYHFDEKYLPLFEKAEIEYLDRAPKWDGNTPEDGLEVLKTLFCGKE